MNREYHRWYSPSLGREMELLIFGHAGAKVLVFPTSMGKFYEWEDRGMMHTLGEHISRGWIQVYCVDSVDKESWYARWKHPQDRARQQTAYENYLLREVYPLMQQKSGNRFLITVGASFGAYHAMNLALRHPWLVDRVIGLSGIYDISTWSDGFGGGEVYFQNPVAYVANEQDPGRLARLRELDIIIVTGRDDPLRGANEHFSHVLWQKQIGHALRIWDGWAHDWPYWQQMMQIYINGSD